MASQHHTTGRPCWSGGPSLDAEVRADGAMPPQILGDGRALAPPARHHYRLTPVTKASVSGRLKDVLSLLLFHCRQLNPLHLFSPPLLRSLTKGYLKKRCKILRCMYQYGGRQRIVLMCVAQEHKWFSTPNIAFLSLCRDSGHFRSNSQAFSQVKVRLFTPD
jgi:hypothetical protein